MENIHNKDYAEFLENTLTELVQLPVEGICIITKMKDGGALTSYYNANMMDKLIFAGVLQQDAMMDVLRANGMVNGENEA